MDENRIIELEDEGIVTATLRRLSPAKKEKLYRAALREFGENVFGRVSLDRIAAAAGVSKGSIFQYFTNKENLLQFTSAVFIDEYRQSFDASSGHESAVKTIDKIRDFFVVQLEYWQASTEQFAFYRKMCYENDHALVRPFVYRMLEIRKEYVVRIVARGVRVGEIRQDIDPGAMAQILLWVFDGLLRHYALDVTTGSRRRYPGKTLDETMALLFDGLRG